MSIQYGKSPKNESVPITTISDFDKRLPSICNSLYEELGGTNLEMVFEKALQIDFEELGIKTEIEKEIPLTYKGKRISSRRVDMIVQFGKKVSAILELKRVDRLEPNHLQQLQYYMTFFDADIGYLINFPKEEGNFLHQTLFLFR